MLDYQHKIKEFITANFEPSDENRANLKWNTGQFLGFLFDVFPRNSISDYELDEILSDLGYTRQTWTEDHTTSHEDDEGKEIFTISKALKTGWCIRSPFSLEPETIVGV